MQECRICMDEAPPLRPLGCACRGSMLLVHAQCADRWFVQQGRTTCEICQTPIAVPKTRGFSEIMCWVGGVLGVTIIVVATTLSIVAQCT